jgi:hypothetical protein
MINEELTDELASLLNRYSVDNDTNTPDFILAEMVAEFLQVYASSTVKRERWFGRTFEETNEN